MSWFKIGPSQELLNVISRIEKLQPKWNAKRTSSRPGEPASTVIWFESEGIRVSISKAQHLRRAFS